VGNYIIALLFLVKAEIAEPVNNLDMYFKVGTESTTVTGDK